DAARVESDEAAILGPGAGLVVALEVDDQVGAAVGVLEADLPATAELNLNQVRDRDVLGPVQVRGGRLGLAGRPDRQPAEGVVVGHGDVEDDRRGVGRDTVGASDSYVDAAAWAEL